MTGIENNDKSNKTSKMLNVDRYRFLIIHRDRSADSSDSRIGRDFGSLVQFNMAKFSQTRCGIPYRLRVSGSQWHIPPYPNIRKVPSLGSSLTYISNTCPLSTLSSTSANALTCNGEWGRAACTHGRPNSERKLFTTATTNKSQ